MLFMFILILNFFMFLIMIILLMHILYGNLWIKFLKIEFIVFVDSFNVLIENFILSKLC